MVCADQVRREQASAGRQSRVARGMSARRDLRLRGLVVLRWPREVLLRQQSFHGIQESAEGSKEVLTGKRGPSISIRDAVGTVRALGRGCGGV